MYFSPLDELLNNLSNGVSSLHDRHDRFNMSFGESIDNVFSIVEYDNKLVFDIAVPGVNKERLEASISDKHELTIKINDDTVKFLSKDNLDDNYNVIHRTKVPAKISVKIPYQFRDDYEFNAKTNLNLENGLLTIVVPMIVANDVKLNIN